ncbi:MULTISPECIES: hypothetical protein [Psychrobacter]|jgi:hypothetical protein|nr:MULTISPECIES: hypothetical protein [Psychrobacter]MDE0844345.1 hypothetical protein [Psychrobacter pacificensis]|tara:strand:+ start:255 stop:848 length:594 start_codon:yes stop_codon:yes gene_type:complete
MTKQHSAVARCSKSNERKQRFFRSKYIYTTLIGMASFSILLVSACSPEPYPENSSLVTDKAALTRDSIAQNSENIEDSIRNSYARLASERADVCPKLIEEQGSQVIERVAEVMVNDYCDYFLYPREGQHISVATNNRQIEALLIVPALHNFANGGYKVMSYDKHIIRLSYNGATYKPQNLNYDIVMTISDNSDKEYS